MAKIPKILLVPLLIFSLILLSLILNNIGRKNQYDVFYSGSKNLFIQSNQNSVAVENIINSVSQKFPGRYALYIKDLKTQKTYKLNSEDKFSSASIYKLAVMYKTFDAIEKNQITDSEILSNNKETLDKKLSDNPKQNQNPEQDQISPELVSFNIKEALRLMITISDNYSAILLAEKLGWGEIDDLMKKEGIDNFDLIGSNSPQITAAAVAKLLERVYANKAVSANASERMKKLLFDQKINDRIPKYLPADIKIGHKTGELGLIRHDAGIILGRKSHYIFVFLTETPSPDDAAENIAQLSKKIFDELEKD